MTTTSSNPVIIGRDLEFTDLENFVNEYLLKTEPNNYIDSTTPSKNLNITHDPSNNKITIIEKPTRPVYDNNLITKQLNTTLNLNNFEISISNINSPNDNKEVLVYGNYKETGLTKACEIINDIIINDTNINYELHSNLYMDYIISYDNNGTQFEIFPLSIKNYIKDDDTTEIINNKINVLINIKIILTFFINKHNEYIGLKPIDLKNKMFIYKLTSPYTSSYPSSIQFKKWGLDAERQIGMQTEGAHMDSCEIGNDNYVDDEYCELSSIIYTNVKNQSSTKHNYYSSAAFFYAPEIPMPVRAETMKEMGIHGSILQNFQNEYKRLFVSAPMTSTGWAIWKNKPKRNVKNIKGNRFNIENKLGFNKMPDSNKYTHFSADNNEFVYHVSPFKAYANKVNVINQSEEICNWAPSDKFCSKSETERLNFTVRRANYNLFRFFRDLFEYDNPTIHKNAYSVIRGLKALLNIYENTESKDCQNLIDNKTELPIFNRIYNNMIILLQIYENNNQTPDIVSLEDKNKKKYTAQILYHHYKNNNIVVLSNDVFELKNKYSIQNSIIMLDQYLNSLLTIITNNKIDALIKWYGANIPQVDASLKNEIYRTLIGGKYKMKYLKYKQKYLELKKMY